jgi:hypothetical protein
VLASNDQVASSFQRSFVDTSTSPYVSCIYPIGIKTADLKNHVAALCDMESLLDASSPTTSGTMALTMAYTARCHCKAHNCNGALVSVNTERSHERANLRRTLQSNIHSGCLMPYKKSHLEPVPCMNPIPAPLIPLVFDSQILSLFLHVL